MRVLGSMKREQKWGWRRNSGWYGYGKCAGKGEKAEKLCLQDSVKQSGKNELKA